MNGTYILDAEGNPQARDDVATWGYWMSQRSNKIIQQTQVGEYWISTIFLGLDHTWDGSGPILFESMVFKSTPEARVMADADAWTDIDSRGYATRMEALAGHTELVRKYEGSPQ